MRLPLPISPKYDSPIFEAVTLQIVIALLALLVIDPVGIARICGIALVAFWGGAAILIWRRPQSPSQLDLGIIRFGYLAVVVIAFLLSCLIWRVRGVL